MSVGQPSCLLDPKKRGGSRWIPGGMEGDGGLQVILGGVEGLWTRLRGWKRPAGDPAPTLLPLPNPSVNNSDSHSWQIKQNKRYTKEASPWPTTSCGWLWGGGVIAAATRGGRGGGRAAGGHSSCLGVRLGLPGLKVSVNCRGDKVRPEGRAHPRQVNPPASL